MTIENLKGLKEAIKAITFEEIIPKDFIDVVQFDVLISYQKAVLKRIEEFEAGLRKKLEHYENAYAPPPYKLSITLDARKDELRKILGDEGAGK